MNIEIVEFYPFESKKGKFKIAGTLHIYLIDYGMDIRGIFAGITKSGAIFFTMPGGNRIDEETGKKVRYPFLGFTDPEKEKALRTEIREKGKKFMEEKFLTVKTSEFSKDFISF